MNKPPRKWAANIRLVFSSSSEIVDSSTEDNSRTIRYAFAGAFLPGLRRAARDAGGYLITPLDCEPYIPGSYERAASLDGIDNTGFWSCRILIIFMLDKPTWEEAAAWLLEHLARLSPATFKFDNIEPQRVGA